MLLINPKNIIFESKDDIIDYVCAGLAPRKKDFEAVMDAIADKHSGFDNGITVSQDLFIMGQEEFEGILRRIYENNRRTRNYILAGIGIAAVVLIGAKIAKHAKEKKEQDEFDAAVDHFLVEHPDINLDRM